jgi:hypothetical protein
MSQIAEIKCINKLDRYNPHERISHIGGDGWKITLQEGIDLIASGLWSFYVSVHGIRVDVIVATHNGHKYLKTRADGDQPNNLLSLRECAWK